jgi:hypothetical protein
MRIYTLHGATSYGCGMAVVAANSPKQAREILRASVVHRGKNLCGLEITRVKCIRGATIERKAPLLISQSSYIE